MVGKAKKGASEESDAVGKKMKATGKCQYNRNKEKFSMDGKTSLKYLQEYIKSKDFHPESSKDYFLKLAEEVGELAEAMRKNILKRDTGSLKGTIDEEVWDVIYYAIAIANCYGIDLECAIKEKEELNKIKYRSNIVFETDR